MEDAKVILGAREHRKGRWEPLLDMLSNMATIQDRLVTCLSTYLGAMNSAIKYERILSLTKKYNLISSKDIFCWFVNYQVE